MTWLTRFTHKQRGDMSDTTYKKLLAQDSKDEPDSQTTIWAQKVAKSGSIEGINLLKSWVRRDETHFATIALSALMLVPKEVLREGDFVECVQQVLLQKNFLTSHTQAATLLGVFSEWPDPALIHAMQHDKSPVVRGEAFRSALMLAGVPYAIARGHAGTVENGSVQATPELVEKLASEYK